MVAYGAILIAASTVHSNAVRMFDGDLSGSSFLCTKAIADLLGEGERVCGQYEGWCHEWLAVECDGRFIHIDVTASQFGGRGITIEYDLPFEYALSWTVEPWADALDYPETVEGLTR